MLFRQLFDAKSCTYTYLLAGDTGGEALLVDPVIERVDRDLQLLDELGLRLVMAMDTHVHADHVTALGPLRDRTRCITVAGRRSPVDVVSMRVDDGDHVEIDGVTLKVLYTPGHTDDSYSFVMADRVFTGDTLLIRGTGRTDFQNGDALAAYDSLFGKLLALPDATLVYPGHDYNGNTVSTIGEERAHNPRLQVASAGEYAAIMDNLRLPNPRMMDVAVAANLAVGLAQDTPEVADHTLDAAAAIDLLGTPGIVFVDLRETEERHRDGAIPSAIHLPYPRLADALKPGSPFRALASGAADELIFYCAFGERSALALRAAREVGIEHARHIAGGLGAWIEAGGPCQPLSD
jgi:glyoxylase-like metal-dependent hydrolase (beta-lactamase superfamily II)